MPRTQPARKAARKTPPPAPKGRGALRTVDTGDDQVDQQPNEASKPRSRVVPASVRKHMESEEQRGPKGHDRRLPSTGKARLDAQNFDVVDKMPNKDKLAALMFNEDELTIRIHESTDKSADPMPTVWNDGVPQRFMRGQEQKVKRKYVEVLARSKVTTYTQRKEIIDGVEDVINVPHTALTYPFAVLHDPAGPKGAVWLKGILEAP